MKKRLPQRFAAVLAALVMLSALFGCSGGSHQTTVPEGLESYRVYYTNATATTLAESYIWVEQSMSSEEKIERVVQAILTPAGNQKSILPDGMELRYELQAREGNLLPSMQIYVWGDYGKLNANQENVLRVGLMKSVIRTKLVASATLFYSSDEAGNKSNLTQVSYLRRDTIIVNEADVDFFRDEVELTLYFANEDGTALASEQRNIVIQADERAVDVVMSLLLAGPETAGYRKVIPSGTAVNDIFVRNQICYVDLNEAFLRNQTGNDLNDLLAIYSIVNSLTKTSGVESVQFLIDGQVRENYRNVPFYGVFAFNEELVEQS